MKETRKMLSLAGVLVMLLWITGCRSAENASRGDISGSVAASAEAYKQKVQTNAQTSSALTARIKMAVNLAGSDVSVSGTLRMKRDDVVQLSATVLGMEVGRVEFSPEDVLIIVDDIDLPMGQVRIRPHGGAGTHNGLRNIDEFIEIKKYIVELSEILIAKYADIELVDKYDVYQVLLSYWQEVMADDVYVTEEQETVVNSGKININTAYAQELMDLPGIGESRAAAIIEYRMQTGGFQSIEEIMNVKGIGTGIFSKISSLICVK